MDDAARTAEFLTTLWPGDEPGHLVVSRLDKTATPAVMRSSWCQGPGEVEEFAARWRGTQDLYIGACRQDRDVAERGSRGTAKGVVAMPGVWADVDVKGPGHKRDDIVPDFATACRLVRATGLEPSVLVSSGGGLQAWWLFQEPWTIETPEERNRAASLAASWVATVQAHGHEQFKSHVDSVGDLARVLRLPGSYNFKVDSRLVTADYTGTRYSPSDFDEFLYIRARVDLAAPPSEIPTGDVPQEVVELVRQCLSALSPRRAEGYEDWIAVGHALKAIGGDAFLPLWREFSSLAAGKYDPAQADAKWKTLQPSRTGLGALIGMARSDSGDDGVGESDPAAVGAAWGETSKSVTLPQVLPRHAPASVPLRRLRVANVLDHTITDSDGKETEVVYYRPMPDIARAVADSTGGWPRRAGSILFSVEGEADVSRPDYRPVQFLTKPDQFMAWLMSRCDARWHAGTCRSAATKEKLIAPTKTEFFEYVKANANPVYSSVELLPHHPPVRDVYYIPTTLPEWAEDFVSPLHELLEALNPETEDDRWLILAALLTPGWGGACGARPAFVLTSEHGRGVGKTSTVDVLAEIWGGSISIGGNEDWDTVRKRLLGDESMTRRIINIDNLKGKLNSADIEGAITCSQLDGWKPYHGQASRPNRLTWFITANSPSLSRDLADRAVIIKIGKQKHGVDFRSWAKCHIEKHRGKILAELFAILRREPVCTISRANRDRWQAWQDAVLSRIEGGDRLAKLCIARRPDVDSDLSDADEIASAIETLFTDRGHLDFASKRIFVTTGAMHQHLVKVGVVDRTFSKRGTVTWLKELCGSGRLASLKFHRHTAGVRGWLYVGDKCEGVPDTITIEELPYHP